MAEKELVVDLSSEVKTWIDLLRTNNLAQAYYASEILYTTAERLASLDQVSHKRPLSEAILLGGRDFPTLLPAEGGTPILLFEATAISAEAWLKKHPESEVAQRIARENLAASLEDHVILVTDMYRESEKERGLPTTDTIFLIFKGKSLIPPSQSS